MFKGEWLRRVVVVGICGAAGCAMAQDGAKGTVVTVSPPRFGYFAKSLECDGFVVRGSAELKDSSMQLACGKIHRMLLNAGAIRQRLGAEGAELQIVAAGQNFMELPGRNVDPPRPFIDNVREGSLYGTCSEQNLLKHELPEGGGVDGCMLAVAQVIFAGGLSPSARGPVFAAWHEAQKAGLWKDSVVAMSGSNYWADLSIAYFGGRGYPVKGVAATGADALRSYDAAGFTALDKIYRGEEQPPELYLTNARKISSAESIESRRGPGEMIVVNDTGDAFRLTRLTALPNAAGWPDAVGTLQRVAMPYERVLLEAGDRDIWVVSDAAGHEIGRWAPLGAGSILHIAR